jgi:polyhydroxyalkanoate synthase
MADDPRGHRLRNLLTLPRRPRPAVGVTPCDVPLTDGALRLLHYRNPTVRHANPVLLVPSLINRHYVLDLQPGRSFAEFLLQQGFDVWCIDWGAPLPEERFLTFDDVVAGRLERCVRRCSIGANGRPVHLFGYCMGGTLAVTYAAWKGQRVASLTAVAAPIAFAKAGTMARWLQGFDVDALVDATGVVPAPLLQASFTMLRPTLPLAKAANVVDRAWNDKFLDGFLALETWATDNVGLPGEFYRRYVKDLYQADRLAAGLFALGGRSVHLGQLTVPLHAVTFQHDSIAPPEACTPLLQLAGSTDKQHTHHDGSHVGGMTSSAAARGLWPQIAQFWLARTGESVR